MMGYIKSGLFTISGECLFKSLDLLNMSSKQLEEIRGRKNCNDTSKCWTSINT